MCEGLPIPLTHAWCIDEDNYVVDPTWTFQNAKRPCDYFGFPFSKPFVYRTLLETKYYGILENLWSSPTRSDKIGSILDIRYMRSLSRVLKKYGASNKTSEYPKGAILAV
jgi:hypothetical protein